MRVAASLPVERGRGVEFRPRVDHRAVKTTGRATFEIGRRQFGTRTLPQIRDERFGEDNLDVGLEVELHEARRDAPGATMPLSWKGSGR